MSKKKKKFSVFRSSRAKPFLGVSIAVSRAFREFSLARVRGWEGKNSLPMAGAKPHSKKERAWHQFFFSKR